MVWLLGEITELSARTGGVYHSTFYRACGFERDQYRSDFDDRRFASDGRRHDDRYADCVPEPHGEFCWAGEQSGQLGYESSGDDRRCYSLR